MMNREDTTGGMGLGAARDGLTREWDFCPECGCMEFHREEGWTEGLRFCVRCGQDWYSDVDYLDVVQANLHLAYLERAERAASQPKA